MTGYAEGRKAHLPEIYGNHSRTLGTVQGKINTLFPTDPANLLRIQQGSAYIGGMQHDDQPGIGAETCLEGFHVQPAAGIAGHCCHFHTNLFHILCRPCNCIMLHS